MNWGHYSSDDTDRLQQEIQRMRQEIDDLRERERARVAKEHEEEMEKIRARDEKYWREAAAREFERACERDKSLE